MESPPEIPFVPPVTVERRPRRTALWVGLGIALLVFLVVAGYVGLQAGGGGSPAGGNGATVVVSSVDWQFSGTGSCFNDTSRPGTSIGGGDVFTVSTSVSYSSKNASACTVESIRSGTNGFSYVQSNAPITIDSGQQATLSVVVKAPTQNVTTSLTLEVTAAPLNQSTTVNVTGVNWEFTGPPGCFGNTTSTGTTVPGGGEFTVSTIVANPASGDHSSCTIQSVSPLTTGFTLVGSDTPLSVSSGSSQTLSVEVRAPSSNRTTVLTIDSKLTAANTTTRVVLSQIDWDFSGASNCWGDANATGETVTGGDQFTVDIRLSYTAGLLDPDSCTVQSESVATSGFTFVSANTPLVVDSGTTETLSVNLIAPDQNTTLTLVLDGVDSSP
jgi:hypothetical protein